MVQDRASYNDRLMGIKSYGLLNGDMARC